MTAKDFLKSKGYSIDTISHPQDRTLSLSEINLFEIMDEYARFRERQQNPALGLVSELGNNISSIYYSTEKEEWTISYINSLNPDKVGNDYIMDFIKNV